jgi:hypothetical protein
MFDGAADNPLSVIHRHSTTKHTNGLPNDHFLPNMPFMKLLEGAGGAAAAKV